MQAEYLQLQCGWLLFPGVSHFPASLDGSGIGLPVFFWGDMGGGHLTTLSGLAAWHNSGLLHTLTEFLLFFPH